MTVETFCKELKQEGYSIEEIAEMLRCWLDETGWFNPVLEVAIEWTKKALTGQSIP